VVWNPRRDTNLEYLGIAPQAIEDLEIVLGKRLVSCRSRSSARLTRLKRLRIAVTDVGGDHGNWASLALDAGPELEFDLEFVACSVLALTLPRDVQRRVTTLRLHNTFRSHEPYCFSSVRTVVFKKVNGDLNACDLARVFPVVASLTLDDCPDTSSFAFLSGFAFLESLTVANTRSELLVTVPEDVKSKVTSLKLEYLWKEPKSLLDWPALLELQTSGVMPLLRAENLRVLSLDCVSQVPVPAVHFASLESLTLTAIGKTFARCFHATATGLLQLRLALFEEDAAVHDFLRLQTRLVKLHLSWLEQGVEDEGLGAHLVPATVRELSCMGLKAADAPRLRDTLEVLTVRHEVNRLRRLLPHTLIKEL
jgi:hypothetical protein